MTDHTVLSSIRRPGRYLGHEYNSSSKTWHTAKIRFNLIFPDLYEIGMSHQGLQILYHLLNRHEEFLAERCYCPDIDLEKLLRKKRLTLTSIESNHPLADFDVLGITLPYELCYSNILTILDLANIPLYSKDRDESFPIVLGGGPCSLNPEPVADFFDAILLGDGEESIVEIATVLAEHKADKLAKDDILHLLAAIEGIYIPVHFQPKYDSYGQFSAIHRIQGVKDHVNRRILKDLNEIDHLKQPLVPNAKIVHDRFGIEVARGCTRGCRFCQAGITYRPVRERRPEKILELAQSGLNSSGFEELSLLSLSTGDYSQLEPTLSQLMDNCAGEFISVAIPSMRVGTLTSTIMEQVKRVRKTGFTIAPEAGSERLRQVINKGITEDALLITCRNAFSLGWRVIKFYFMIGLPTETKRDIDAIVKLVNKALAVCEESQGGKKMQINVSLGTFVPKPHTPFQWERQLSVVESTEYIHHLRDALDKKRCKLRYHSPQASYLEGVFSRGDRRLGKLLHCAWRAGTRLDGWDEHFDLCRWQEAAKYCGLNLDSYLRNRTIDEPLPWQHLQTGIDLQFLKNELHRAKQKQYTPDCRDNSCHQCGLCDFKTILPVVYNRLDTASETGILPTTPKAKCTDNKQPKGTSHFKYIVHYSRTGNICYLGHLEILQVIFRTFRRASIQTNFSQGFNPSPKVSFGPALPVGTASLAEFFIMDLSKPLKNPEVTIKQLNDKLILGLKVTKIKHHPGKIPQKINTSYILTLVRNMTDQEKTRIVDFINSDNFIVTKTRKTKTKDINIRPLINDLSITGSDTLQLEMISTSTQPSIKPVEVLTKVLGLDIETALNTKILKTGWHALTED